MTRPSHGFTLVEILIVVIILGILAAMVIPQFANASTDSKTANLRSTLQSLRGQIQLFDAQHGDIPPQTTGMNNWQLLMTRSNTTETNIAAPTGTTYGPYVQSLPINPLNNKSGTSTAATDTASGWYYSATLNGYTLYARDANGATITSY